MKFTLIATAIFTAFLSVVLFVPPIAKAVEYFYGTGAELTLGMQFLRLGVLSGLFFVITLIVIKVKEFNDENYYIK